MDRFLSEVVDQFFQHAGVYTGASVYTVFRNLNNALSLIDAGLLTNDLRPKKHPPFVQVFELPDFPHEIVEVGSELAVPGLFILFREALELLWG